MLTYNLTYRSFVTNTLLVKHRVWERELKIQLNVLFSLIYIITKFS